MRALLLAAIAALATGALSPRAGAGWWDDLDKGESVRLADVFAQPSAHSDNVLSFFCVLLGRDEVFFPIGTPFNEAKWDNVAVWDDGAPLWEEETFKRRARPYLYIEKRHPQRDGLFRLEPFTRLEVTGRIRAVHRGIPFLEILSWRLSGWRLGNRVIEDVIRGDNKVREGGDANLEIALDSYTRALRPDLPPVYALQIRKRAADVLRRLGRQAEAETMEGTEIHGGRFAPDSPTGTGPSTMEPPISEDLPGVPVTAPPTAPLVTPSTDLPGVPVDVAPLAPPTAFPTPATPPAAGVGTPLIGQDLPGVEVPPAAPAPGSATPVTPVAPTPLAPTAAAPTPAAPTPLAPSPPAPSPVAPTPSAPTPSAPTWTPPSPPATPGAAARPGELPAPVVRPATSSDLPPPPAGSPSGTPAPVAVPPVAAPPVHPAPAAPAPTAPVATAPAAQPSPLPPPAQSTPPKRQPRLEGVK